jgi:hypothetical protein
MNEERDLKHGCYVGLAMGITIGAALAMLLVKYFA